LPGCPTPPTPPTPPTKTGTSAAGPAIVTYSISGTIRVGGVGLANVFIEAFVFGGTDYGVTYTDADGNYTVSGLSPGNYLVYVSDDGHHYLTGYYKNGAVDNFAFAESDGTPVTVPGNQTGINVQLENGRLITGKVFDPNGVALANISSEAYNDSYNAQVLTDEYGNFMLQVPPSASYILYFYNSSHTYLDGYYDVNVSDSHFNQDYAQRTEVAVGASADVSGITVKLTLTPPWAVTLSADRLYSAPGVPVMLKATTNQDVDYTSPLKIVIENSSNTVLTSCGSGTTCSWSVVTGSVEALDYHAVIAHNDGTVIQATSNTVKVSWTVDHLTISPAETTIANGMSQAYTAEGFDSTNADLGDITAGTIFIVSGGSCTGAVCTPGGAGDATVDASQGIVEATSTAVLHVTADDTYNPVTPVRLLDTRHNNGLSSKLSAHVPATFHVTERGGVSNVPTGATAVTANVTIVKPSASASVYLGPEPIVSPTTATISFNKGDITAFGSTIALKSDGTMSATYMASSGTTDLVMDVTGYFTPDNTGATYHPLTPARLLDTRIKNGLPGKFVAGVPRSFLVWGRGGVPTSATAVTGNLTVVNSTSSWAVYLGPDKIVAPPTSTINFAKGQIRANSLTVPLSTDGKLAATFLSSGTSKTDLVFDVTGYYTDDLTGSRYAPLSPAPVVNTAVGIGLTGKFVANTPRTFGVAGQVGVPAYATGVTGIVSVANQTGSWAIFVGPIPAAKPSTSALNFLKADKCSNGVTVALGGSGTLSITYMGGTGSTTNVMFVVTGYFVP
jgi:hypothetical protein